MEDNMAFLNCGAKVNGVRPKTKKALREAMATDPDSVTFDSTSMFDSFTYRGSNIPQDATLVVVGPDPYNTRNWYANVVSSGKVS